MGASRDGLIPVCFLPLVLGHLELKQLLVCKTISFMDELIRIFLLTPHPGPYLEDTKHGPHTRESLHSLIQGALLLPHCRLHTQGNSLDQGDKHLDEAVCLWGKIVK